MPKRTATGRVIRDADTSDDEQLSDVDEAFLQAHERSMSTGEVTFKREETDELSVIKSLGSRAADKQTPSVRGKAVKRDRGSGVNLQDKTHGRTALHRAAAKGAIEKVRSLIEQGADLAIRDNAEVSALHEAVAKSRLEVVRLLLKEGADVEPRDIQGDYPLLDAAQNDDIDICRVLLEAGANPTLQNENGCSALSEADEGELKELLRRYSENFRGVQQPKQTQTATVMSGELPGNGSPHDSIESGTANHRSAPRGAKSSTVQMERLGPRRVDASGRDALHNCVLDGDEDALEQWLDIQPCTFTDKDRCTPLHSAARLGHARICRMLLDKGAKHSARNSIGNTPLHEACFKRDNKLVMETLLEAHASVLTENDAGLTPLRLAGLELGEDARELRLLERAEQDAVARIAKRQHPPEDSEQPRKKRGRPRKHPLVESDTSDQQISGVTAASPVNVVGSPSKPTQQNSRHQSPVLTRTAPASPLAVQNGDGLLAASTPVATQSNGPREIAPMLMHGAAVTKALSPSADLSPVASKHNADSTGSPLRNLVAAQDSMVPQTAHVNGYSTPPTSNSDALALTAIGTRLDDVSRLVTQLSSQQQAQQKRDEQDKVERQQIHAALAQIATTVASVRNDVERLMQERPAAEVEEKKPRAAVDPVKSLADTIERSQAEMARAFERQTVQVDRLAHDTHSYMRTVLHYLQQLQQPPVGQQGYNYMSNAGASPAYGPPSGYAGQQAATGVAVQSSRASVDGRAEATPPMSGNGIGVTAGRAASLQPPSHQHYAQQASTAARPPIYSPQQQHQQQLPGQRTSVHAPAMQQHPPGHTHPERSPVIAQQQAQVAGSAHHTHSYGAPSSITQHPHQFHRSHNGGREYSAERRTPIAAPPSMSAPAMSQSQSPAMHGHESTLPSLAVATGGAAGYDRYVPHGAHEGNGWQQKSAAEMAPAGRGQHSAIPAVGSGPSMSGLPAIQSASAPPAGAHVAVVGHGVHDSLSNVRGSIKLDPPPPQTLGQSVGTSGPAPSAASPSGTASIPAHGQHQPQSVPARTHVPVYPPHPYAHPHASTDGGAGAAYYDPIRRA